MLHRIGRIWPVLIPVAVGIYFAFLANGAPVALGQINISPVGTSASILGGPSINPGGPLGSFFASAPAGEVCSIGAYPTGTIVFAISTSASAAPVNVIAYTPAAAASILPNGFELPTYNSTGTTVTIPLSNGTSVTYGTGFGTSAVVAGQNLSGLPIPAFAAGYTGNGLCLNPPPPGGYYLTTNSATIAPGQTITFSSPTYFGLTSGFGVTTNANAYGPFAPNESVTCNLYTNNNPAITLPPPAGPGALLAPAGEGGSTVNTSILPTLAAPGVFVPQYQPSIIWATTTIAAGLNGAITGTITLPSAGPQPGAYFVILCFGNSSSRVAVGPNPPMFNIGIAAVPEASTLLLFGGGLSGLAGYAGLKLRGIRNRIGL